VHQTEDLGLRRVLQQRLQATLVVVDVALYLLAPTELHRIFCGARTRHYYTQIKENQFWCQSACNKSAKLRLRNPKQKVENGAYFEGDYAVQEYNARANGQRVPESARQSGGEQYHL